MNEHEQHFSELIHLLFSLDFSEDREHIDNNVEEIRNFLNTWENSLPMFEIPVLDFIQKLEKETGILDQFFIQLIGKRGFDVTHPDGVTQVYRVIKGTWHGSWNYVWTP